MQTDFTATMPPPDDIDHRLREELKHAIGTRNYAHWFQDKMSLQFVDDEVTIGVGSPFLLSWIQKQFRSEVHHAATAVLGPAARVQLIVDASVAHQIAASDQSPAKRQPAVAKPDPSRQTGAGGRAAHPAGRRRFADLADFVIGPCNRLASTAAAQVSGQPGELYNPLFLHGGVGTGKTHLLEGIYRQWRRRFPSLRVMYLTAESFANYFTQALRDQSLPGFRQRFRNVDALLVDDIDFFDGKRATQEEFLHTFKQLESHGRQIVVSSDRHPRLLKRMSDELTTRFVSGLVCRLEPPDVETRKQIVQRKASRMGGCITDEALAFVAQRFKNNVRELEGALNCLQTYHTMIGKRVTAGMARSVLSELERDCIHIVRLSDVEHAVCTFFGIEPEDLKSSRRHRSLAQPRMLAMFLARKHTQAPYSEIGRHFGGRNHSTVVAAEKKVKVWLAEQSSLQVATETWNLSDIVESLEYQLHAG